ncbi:MAG TPA: Mbeg1-like protein [Luteimonas sp.]|nr:Mbeg1-like protein [Luteimonas sp.]
MGLTVGDSAQRSYVPQPPPTVLPPDARRAAQPATPYVPEPAYHPQVGAPGTCGPGPAMPYDAANFSTFISGTQGRQVDVDMMRMSFATYEGGPQSICGWTALDGEQLQAAGMDPGKLDVPGSQFKAMVFTDGQGNYVLAFRGTQEGAADWMTNFAQGTGQVTDEFDRLAPQAAQEFARAFGERGVDADGNPAYTNLAITGHSQGGGLATVASAVTGIPAVTFDPSGVHDRTFERLGLDGEQFRQQAEDGQVRRYSMFEDALTQAQENWFTAPLAPDAIGHKIVVKPEGELADSVIEYGLGHMGVDEGTAGTITDIVEWLPNLPGPLGGIGSGVRDLARAVSSHEQQLMIDTMLQQEPWQDGYVNPESNESPFNSREVERRVTEEVAQGVDEIRADVAQGQADIAHIQATDVAEGRHVQAGWSIAGEQLQTGLNVTGDVISSGADVAAATVEGMAADAGNSLDARADAASNPVERALLEGSAGAVRLLGQAGGGITRVGGNATQAVLDGAGWIADKGSDVIGKVDQALTDGWKRLFG